MLAPDERALYGECLEPPPEHRFDCGIATTFTLNLETLLVLPVTLAAQRAEEPGALLQDPVALLEALRDTTDRLAVFHQAGRVAVPPKSRALFGLLEECVLPVALPSGAAFHPKLWLVRYRHVDDGTSILRAVVSSRNLTFDASWDTVLCLEGTPTGRRVRDSYGLRDLVAALPDLARGTMSDARRALVAELAESVAHTRFAAPAPFREPVRFHAIGLEGRPFGPTVDGAGKRVLCVSPFVSASAMARAAELAAEERILVARGDELDGLGADAVAGWDVRILADAVETGDTADDAVEESSSAGYARGLHAKAVIVEDHQRRVTWWLGSANLTRAAWEGHNVELMVQLESTAKHAGIDNFLDAGFGKLLEPWARTEPDPELVRQEAATKRAEAARDAIVAASLRLSCTEESDGWRLAVEGTIPLPEGVVGRAWPLTLAERSYSIALDEGPPSWSPIALASLSSMIAFELSSTFDGAQATLRFALQLPHDPFPEERVAQIVQSVIGSRQGFFRYLRILLAAVNGESAVLGVPGLAGSTTGGGAAAALGVFDEVLLEDLVRTLSREPERLRAVDRLVDDLSKTPTEHEHGLVPPEFLSLWEAIREARGTR